MNNTTLNRWLKPLAILLVIVLIVMLLIPAELTDEQLAQIKPGMTLQAAKDLLGDVNEKEWVLTGDLIMKPDGYECTATFKGKFFKPNITVTMKGVSLGHHASTWIGKSHLLWVEHKNGIVMKTCLFPITRTGGGLQGCIDTIKQYWNDWRK